MSLRCPKCLTQSAVTRHEAGEGGRMVRCTRCGTAWLARHVAGDVYGAERAALGPVVARQPLIIEGEIVRPSARYAATAARPGPVARPAVATNRPGSTRRSFGALATAMAFAVIVALAVPIAGAIPGIAGLFSTGDGMVLDQIKSASRKVGGTDVIIVEGQLTNATGSELAVPAIRISLRTDSSDDAYSWLVEPSAMRLAAGASIGFRSAMTSPVPGASRIAVSLAPREQRIGMR